MPHPHQNSKLFWGSIPQTPLVASAFPYCKRRTARNEATRKRIVCPCCALASAVFWLRPCSVHDLTFKFASPITGMHFPRRVSVNSRPHLGLTGLTEEIAISCTKCSHPHTITHVHTLTTICLPNNSLCAERHQQQRCSYKSQHDGLVGAPCVLIGLCTELLQAMHGHAQHFIRHRSPVAGPVVAWAAPRGGGETAGRAQKVRQD